MVPLTMAIYNGYHPSARWDFGPKTGKLTDFKTFDEFYAAFEKQFDFIYKQGTEASLQILKVQQHLMPAPLNSALLENCIKDGVGMTHGGAKYNSSGGAFTALSDVVDSLLVIKKVIFEDKKYTFDELKDAMDADFIGHKSLHSYISNRVPKFGSGDESGRLMVDRVTTMIADYMHSHDNGRGGCYFPGYRTNNNHTVYGRVSGASASGRHAGKPFTSGLTPNPAASNNILDNLNDVASINPLNCDNNYTFNVRVSFSEKDENSHKQNVDHLANYIQTYFINGGMQIQCNVVDTDTLKDAMAHPELYQDLIARVSGYTGYYTRMQQDLQLEIIGRTEFKI
jgi:formate C-acetyltransferase